MTNSKITITEAEYEVMRVVWANKAVKSREIIEVLTDSMDWNESTIKTLIGRLVEKGALSTEKEGRSFIYSAAISEQHTLRKNIDDLFSLVCNTQENSLVKEVISKASLSRSDIDELISLLANKQEKAPETIECACTPGQCEHHLIH